MTTSNRLPTVYVSRKGHSIKQRAELVLRLCVPPIVLMGLKLFKAKPDRRHLHAGAMTDGL